MAPIHHQYIRGQLSNAMNTWSGDYQYQNTYLTNAHTSYNFAWSAAADVQYALSKHIAIDFS